jgi:hypothetical protein
LRRTKESKPFFLAFATIYIIILGVIMYGLLQVSEVTNTCNLGLEVEARLR